MNTGNIPAGDARTDSRTISDFGEQWTRYTDNSGYYGSPELLADIIEPLLPVSEIAGKRVAEIGSGTGRIVNMLLDAGAAHVIAVEPSEAHRVLAQNTQARAARVRIVNAPGQHLPTDEKLDVIVSIGVLHHVTDPGPIVRNARDALKSGGRMLVWLYGKEGNEAYLAIFGPLRAITKRLPHPMLSAACYVLDAMAMVYGALARWVRLPMRDYIRNVYGRMAPDKRRLIVYDQLNPAYAKYYTREEALALLRDNGFMRVQTHWRHGYSWTVLGEV